MLEHRTFKCEVRDMNADTGRFIGYTAVFGHVLPYFNERMMPGSFDKTLAERGEGRHLLNDHETWVGHIVGAQPDPKGLMVEGEMMINDVQAARERWALMKSGMMHGIPSGLSVGFRAIKDRIVEKGIRNIEEVDWVESSSTPFPASAPSQITGLRSLRNLSVADLEKALAEMRAADVDEPEHIHSIYQTLDRALTDLRA